jgi:3-oxoacyl-[acyl-carrier-protein] synthase-3
MNTLDVSISNIEYFLPELVDNGRHLKNDNPDWDISAIEEKTGIFERRISSDNQTAVDLGIEAAKKLFDQGVSRKDIESLILITQSPDNLIPTNACVLQSALKIPKSCCAFDINLGCSGFVYALSIAGGMIHSKILKNSLIICSETYTKYINKDDRSCRPIFSDGAAAIFIEQAQDNQSIGPFILGTDGTGANDLILKNSGVNCYINNDKKHLPLYMHGSRVFMFALTAVPKSVSNLLRKANLQIQDIDLFIFHQASKVAIDSLVGKLKIPNGKVFRNYDKIGNTVSASIPIALKDALNRNLIQKGDVIMLIGFGVGYSWGACLIRW